MLTSTKRAYRPSRGLTRTIQTTRGTRSPSTFGREPTCSRGCHRPLAHLPAPFAHAFATGKDWRWLYRVHASTLPNKPDTSFSGPVAYYTSPTTIVRCDLVEGHSRGYTSRVTINASGGEVIEWYEWMHDAAGRKLWSIACDREQTCHQESADPAGGPYTFAFFRSGARRWVTLNASGPGALVGIYASGTHYHGRHVADVITSISHHSIDGRVIIPMRNGKPHGVKRSLWHNGDTMETLYHDGEFVDVVEFVCSPTCPRPEYAGVKISGCTWRPSARIAATDGNRYSVVVPVDDSDAARLFWRYVSDGLIGWDPRIRRTVLDGAAAGLT